MNVVIALVMWPSWMLMSPICLLRYLVPAPVANAGAYPQKSVPYTFC